LCDDFNLFEKNIINARKTKRLYTAHGLKVKAEKTM
jgi:hypothetical protein